mmetsp:Transcript_12667/g.17030  ORF Transcript_12667/g.17030 Transcript_12667/m.17030 type:complete len:316 (-) Transcript_12667:149-1096(-)
MNDSIHEIQDDDDSESGDVREMAAELKRPPVLSHVKKNETVKPVQAPATYNIAAKQRKIREQLRSRRGIHKGTYETQDDDAPAKYIHAPKLKGKWHYAFDFIWVIISGILFLLCFGIFLRRRRKRKKRQSLNKKKDLTNFTSKNITDRMNNDDALESGKQHITIPPAVRGAASDNRGLRTIQRFLNLASSPDLRDSVPPRRTLLQLAAAAGATQIVKTCLKAGANPNLADDAGDTSLHLAAVVGSGSTVKLLLDSGADPNIRDALGKLAADRANDCDNKGCALLLARHRTSSRPSRGGSTSSALNLAPGLQQRRT